LLRCCEVLCRDDKVGKRRKHIKFAAAELESLRLPPLGANPFRARRKVPCARSYQEQAGADQRCLGGTGSNVRIQTAQQWSRPMRSHLLLGALGLALAVGPPAAGAQTVIAPGFGQPVGAVIVPQQPPIPTATVVQPAATIRTTETVRSVRQVPALPAHRQVVTRDSASRRVLPAPAAIAETIPAVPQPLYDAAVPAVVPRPLYDVAVPAAVPQPLYDAAVPASADDYYSGAPYDAAPAVMVAAPVPAEPMTYRYVYEPDRILVIDPMTNIAVQAIPR
jgi:hypothetical protein